MVPSVQISLAAIRDEARELVQQGVLSRHQPIYVLCQHFPACEWDCIESELEENDFLLRDPIIDLFGREDWQED